MSRTGRIRGYGLGLIALAVALSTTGYYLAGQTLGSVSPQGRAPAPPRNIADIETARGPVQLAVYKVTGPRQLETARRQSLRPDQGIYYHFPSARDEGWNAQGFRAPASVAFMDSRGRILTILDVEPCPAPPEGRACRTYQPRVVYRKALEVKRGWFAQHAVGPGATVEVRLPANSQ